MRIFLAGIMQGSHAEALLHDQQYRTQIKRLVEAHFPQAELYDPRAEHAGSLDYDEGTGREVFFRHNLMCREIDVLLAFLPEASMGTAIEMWEAYRHGAAVIAISPLKHNWAVKFLSHAVYDGLPEFEGPRWKTARQHGASRQPEEDEKSESGRRHKMLAQLAAAGKKSD